MHFLKRSTFVFAGCLFSLPAYAYLDPATGSLILQGLIAGFAGLMLTAKLYWRKIKSFFSSNKEHEHDPDDQRMETTTVDKEGSDRD